MELFGYQKTEFLGLKPATNAIYIVHCVQVEPIISDLYVYL